MKKIIWIAVMLASFFAGNIAAASERQKTFSLEEALNSPEAKDKLSHEVELYFGNQKHPKVVESFRTARANKKTNGFGKSDEKACKRALISALMNLQAQALRQDGNAIINIKSYYQNQETNSETEYLCVSGALMSGVSLKGTVVKLSK
jgi:hypothetical protein